MFSKIFGVILPGGTPPSAKPEDGQIPQGMNARGPSEQGKTHLPEMPPLFLPPPFTPSHIIFSYFANIASTEFDDSTPSCSSVDDGSIQFESVVEHTEEAQVQSVRQTIYSPELITDAHV